MKRILAVDDDPQIRELLQDYLGDQGYAVVAVGTAAAARAELARGEPALILLDLKLPDADGLQMARDIRADSNVPIVMLTGRGDEVDRIVGLEVGADDYVAKPFSPRELLARIKAVLRRAQPAAEARRAAVGAGEAGAGETGAGETGLAGGPGGAGAGAGTGLPLDDGMRLVVGFADWTFDLERRHLAGPDGRAVELTNAEFLLLAAFVKRPQRVLSRDQLLDLSRNDGGEVFDRAIDVQILRLRRKIEADPKLPELIKTERGAGYIFTPQVVRL